MPKKQKKYKRKFNSFLDHTLFIFFIILLILSIIGIALIISGKDIESYTKADKSVKIKIAKTWQFSQSSENWQGKFIKSLYAKGDILNIFISKIPFLYDRITTDARPAVFNKIDKITIGQGPKYFMLSLAVEESASSTPKPVSIRLKYIPNSTTANFIEFTAIADNLFHQYKVKLPEFEPVIITYLELIFEKGLQPNDYVKIDWIKIGGINMRPSPYVLKIQ